MARNAPNKTDRISQLPEQILGIILSNLSLKEAGKTCLLSKRWISVWTYVNVLNFEASWEYKTEWVYRDIYRKWVNQVLQSIKCCNLDEFSVYFERSSSPRHDIDNWLDFAIRKRVRRLTFDMGPLGIRWFPYTFPTKVFDFIKTPFGLTCINSLTKLSLKDVDVTSEIVEHFLSNSPHLEQLFVSDCTTLRHLKVEGTTLRLKILELFWCIGLKWVKIFAPNLVFLKFNGGLAELEPRLIIKHAPSLVEVFASSTSETAPNAFCFLLTHFGHLQTLLLSMTLHEGMTRASKFPELTHLKKLTLRLSVYDSERLFEWISLVERAPSLHTFILELIMFQYEAKTMTMKACKHECLKVLKFQGNVKHSIHIGVAKYLIGIAISLDKIIINRNSKDLWEHVYEYKDSKKDAQESALELETMLPPGAKLVVI